MNIPSTENGFKFKECTIAGDLCWLVVPTDMGTSWTSENSRFRSCIFRQSDYYVVSQGFGKFTNFGEKPLFDPWDSSWPVEARHKLDGSLLIVSRYKGELVVRTRGTADARSLNNGYEIDQLIQKYPLAFSFCDLDQYTLLFEWTTPSNVIVLSEHDEPTLTLVGMIHTQSATYATQQTLDDVAKAILVGRPKQYYYSSIEECILDVSAWVGKEGVVLYSPDGQTLKKIKADAYCELHKLATGIKSVGHVLDVYMTAPTRFTSFDEFYAYIESTLDFEIAEKCKPFIDQIINAALKVFSNIQLIKHDCVSVLADMETRRDQAIWISQNYSGIMTAFAFKILDNKEIDDKLMHRAISENL